jgi:hypothetical protein
LRADDRQQLGALVHLGPDVIGEIRPTPSELRVYDVQVDEEAIGGKMRLNGASLLRILFFVRNKDLYRHHHPPSSIGTFTEQRLSTQLLIAGKGNFHIE